MSPRGRRPGGGDTRADIIDAARDEFAEGGYDTTSLRAVARRAGVDPSLVHHYFDGKPALFAAVIGAPADPAALVGRVISGPREAVGENLVRTFLTLWDSAEGQPRLMAILRSAMTQETARRMMREFLTREVFGRIAREFAGEASPDEIELRAGLAAGQMAGMALMRYVIEVPAVVRASQEDLVRCLAPTLQRYLVED